MDDRREGSSATGSHSLFSDKIMTAEAPFSVCQKRKLYAVPLAPAIAAKVCTSAGLVSYADNIRTIPYLTSFRASRDVVWVLRNRPIDFFGPADANSLRFYRIFHAHCGTLGTGQAAQAGVTAWVLRACAAVAHTPGLYGWQA